MLTAKSVSRLKEMLMMGIMLRLPILGKGIKKTQTWPTEQEHNAEEDQQRPTSQ